MNEKKTRQNKVYSISLILTTGIYMLFIWIHSSLSAEASTEESTSVLGFVDMLFKNLGLSVELTDHIIRKTAHFCEFALLGVLVIWTSYVITGYVVKNLLSCGFVCLATAVIDETIQLFAPGRACLVTDVILDFSGAVTGFVVFIIFINIYKVLIKKKRGKVNE